MNLWIRGMLWVAICYISAWDWVFFFTFSLYFNARSHKYLAGGEGEEAGEQ